MYVPVFELPGTEGPLGYGSKWSQGVVSQGPPVSELGALPPGPLTFKGEKTYMSLPVLSGTVLRVSSPPSDVGTV